MKSGLSAIIPTNSRRPLGGHLTIYRCRLDRGVIRPHDLSTFCPLLATSCSSCPASFMSERPPASSYNALRTMQSNHRVSALEIRLRKALWSGGLKGYRLNAKLPGSPDLVYPSSRVAVFVHGCFWHQCPKGHLPAPKANAEFWRRKFEENRRRDERAADTLLSNGWTVLTLWECDLRADLGLVVDQVRKAIRPLEGV